MARRCPPARTRSAATALALLIAAACRSGTAGDAVGAGPARVAGPPPDDAGADAAAAPADPPADPPAGIAAEVAGGGDAAAEERGRYAVATAVVGEVAVWDRPGELAPVLHLQHPNAEGAPLVLDVLEVAGSWLQVRLPVRPNGSTGWIRAADVSLARHSFRIEVRLAERELRVFDGDAVVQLEPIGVGHRPTPTPGGVFYLYELLQPANPDGPYGPYAFGLSGFSEALEDFGGGDGRLGIHGTDDPASIGRDSTNGCIRLANPAIEQLARTVPLGTPVAILG